MAVSEAYRSNAMDYAERSQPSLGQKLQAVGVDIFCRSKRLLPAGLCPLWTKNKQVTSPFSDACVPNAKVESIT